MNYIDLSGNKITGTQEIALVGLLKGYYFPNHKWRWGMCQFGKAADYGVEIMGISNF